MLQVAGICKRFGSTEVLKGIDFELSAGEFVGLLGPNGAGKSTLIKILAGVHSYDSGSIHLQGEPVRNLAATPLVGIIHQDLGIVDTLSIADNLMLGASSNDKRWGVFLRRHAEYEAAVSALAAVGLSVDPAHLAATLSPGEKALLAVARLLGLGAKLLIVDEVTSTLPPRDAQRLIETLTGATEAGATVILVSHKLSEVLAGAERAVVLVDGHVAADTTVAAGDRTKLMKLMRSGEAAEARSRRPHGTEVRARLKGVATQDVSDVEFDLRAGEVVGLTGTSGSGMHEVALALAGVTPVLAGEIEIGDEVRTALVPPQREVHGSIESLPMGWNLTLSSLRRWRRGGTLRLHSESADSNELCERLSIVPPDLAISLGKLSGGNQQKVLFGRALLQDPDVAVFCEPTRGVDVATRAEIYVLISSLAEKGVGILVATSDAEDLFAVCDRVALMSSGYMSSLKEIDQLTDQDLLEML